MSIKTVVLGRSTATPRLRSVSIKSIPSFAMHASSDTILEAARAKLLASDVPVLLRIAGFIRLSYKALENDSGYAQMLQILSKCYSEWWKSCDIRPDGCLICWDPVIHELLVPILQLHPAIMAAQPHPPQPRCLPQPPLHALTGVRGG